MMQGVSGKAAMSSSFSKRFKIASENVFPLTMGTGTGDEADTQQEGYDKEVIEDFGSQLSFNSSTH